MPNAFLTPQMIARGFLVALRSSLYGEKMHVGAIEHDYRLGHTVRIATSRGGLFVEDLTPEGLMRQTCHHVHLEHQIYVDIEYPDEALTVSADAFYRQVLEPAAQILANGIGDLWPEGATLVCASLNDLAGASSWVVVRYCLRRGLNWSPSWNDSRPPELVPRASMDASVSGAEVGPYRNVD